MVYKQKILGNNSPSLQKWKNISSFFFLSSSTLLTPFFMALSLVEREKGTGCQLLSLFFMVLLHSAKRNASGLSWGS